VSLSSSLIASFFPSLSAGFDPLTEDNCGDSDTKDPWAECPTSLDTIHDTFSNLASKDLPHLGSSSLIASFFPSLSAGFDPLTEDNCGVSSWVDAAASAILHQAKCSSFPRETRCFYPSHCQQHTHGKGRCCSRRRGLATELASDPCHGCVVGNERGRNTLFWQDRVSCCSIDPTAHSAVVFCQGIEAC
jgi:hypothetical protein